MTVEFARAAHPSPTTQARLAEILADPGFGSHFGDHVVSIDYTEGVGWHDARVEPYANFLMDPAAMVLHYGQSIFEGLKAYRQPDNSIGCFRIESNAKRFQKSARRMAMPELPEELFIESIRQLIAADERWVPAGGGEDSLYLRPFMFATEALLGVRPAHKYRYLLISSPAGRYFKGGVKPVTVWVSEDYVRAAPGGTGEAKCAGNYAASLAGQAEAISHGCDQVVWLDGVERRYVEEMGTNNLFFVFGAGADARLVTPALSGSLLPGITRDSLLTLASDSGLPVEERKISLEEWRTKADSGEITEVFGCGTAAVITPVGSVKGAHEDFEINGGKTGEVTMALRDTLTGIQRGTFADSHNWMMRVS